MEALITTQFDGYHELRREKIDSLAQHRENISLMHQTESNEDRASRFTTSKQTRVMIGRIESSETRQQ